MSQQDSILAQKLYAERNAAVLSQTPESKVKKAALDSVIAKLEVAQKAPKQKNQPLTDAEVTDVIQATSKEYQKSIDAFQKAADEATSPEAKQTCEAKIQGIKEEQVFLSKYLPAQMTEPEITVHVQAILAELAITDVKQAGRVVGEFSKRFPKAADGKLVKEVAEKLLTA